MGFGTKAADTAAIKDAVEIIDNFISGLRGLVTEDNSAAIKTSVELIDNAISGNEIQADVVAALPAGPNLIGKVSEPAIVETPFTGTGNLVVGTHKIAPTAAFILQEITLHLSAAPTTGTQNLVITLDSAQGAAYDEVLSTLDLVANAVTDLSIKPKKRLQSGDVVTAAWTNTNGVTYGLVFKHQLT